MSWWWATRSARSPPRPHAKLAWGTGFLCRPAQNVKQNADILKLVTHDNAQLPALSGPRTPYPGKPGVVEPGARADLILVDGHSLEDLSLLAAAWRDPEDPKAGQACPGLVS